MGFDINHDRHFHSREVARTHNRVNGSAPYGTECASQIFIFTKTNKKQ